MTPPYLDIIKVFEQIIQNSEKNIFEKKFRFQWIGLLVKYNSSEKKYLSENAKYFIKEFINKYEIDLSSYLNYLNS